MKIIANIYIKVVVSFNFFPSRKRVDEFFFLQKLEFGIFFKAVFFIFLFRKKRRNEKGRNFFPANSFIGSLNRRKSE